MEEKSEKREEFEDRVGLVLYAAFTVITIIALFCVAIFGYKYDMYGAKSCVYGRSASMGLYDFMMVFFARSDSVVFVLMVWGSLIGKIILLVKCSRIRYKLLVLIGISLFLIWVTIIVVEPVSESIRANKDIPEEIVAHFTEVYGAEDLTILVVKKREGYQPSVSYKVKSPAVAETVGAGYTTQEPRTLEYEGETWVLNESTGRFEPDT